jgi:hypothetical protein
MSRTTVIDVSTLSSLLRVVFDVVTAAAVFIKYQIGFEVRLVFAFELDGIAFASVHVALLFRLPAHH